MKSFIIDKTYHQSCDDYTLHFGERTLYFPGVGIAFTENFGGEAGRWKMADRNVTRDGRMLRMLDRALLEGNIPCEATSGSSARGEPYGITRGRTVVEKNIRLPRFVKDMKPWELDGLCERLFDELHMTFSG